MAALQESLSQTLGKKSPASPSDYGTLLAAFQAASERMKTSSASFNKLLVAVPSDMPEGERRSRIATAASAYEDAREEFLDAVAKLHEFMIGEIISSRSTIQFSATHG